MRIRITLLVKLPIIVLQMIIKMSEGGEQQQQPGSILRRNLPGTKAADYARYVAKEQNILKRQNKIFFS